MGVIGVRARGPSAMGVEAVTSVLVGRLKVGGQTECVLKECRYLRGADVYEWFIMESGTGSERGSRE